MAWIEQVREILLAVCMACLVCRTCFVVMWIFRGREGSDGEVHECISRKVLGHAQ